MKALTVKQPWAWLLIHGTKDIENRNWPTSLRGEIAIHAAKGMPRGEYADANVGLQISRQISHLVHMVSGVTARKYQSGSFTGYNRVIWDARVGVSFSPRDIPLHIW